MKYAAPTAFNCQVYVDDQKAGRRVKMDVSNHAATRNQPVEAEKFDYVKSRPWLGNQRSECLPTSARRAARTSYLGQ